MNNVDNNVIARLFENKDVAYVRVSDDAFGDAFSYHAFNSSDIEILYTIPSVFDNLVEVNREWGEEAINDSILVSVEKYGV